MLFHQSKLLALLRLTSCWYCPWADPTAYLITASLARESVFRARRQTDMWSGLGSSETKMSQSEHDPKLPDSQGLSSEELLSRTDMICNEVAEAYLPADEIMLSHRRLADRPQGSMTARPTARLMPQLSGFCHTCKVIECSRCLSKCRRWQEPVCGPETKMSPHVLGRRLPDNMIAGLIARMLPPSGLCYS